MTAIVPRQWRHALCTVSRHMTLDTRPWGAPALAKPSGTAEISAEPGAGLSLLGHMGAATLLAVRCVKALRRRRLDVRAVVRQIELLGVRSLGVAIISSVLIGMVMGT